MASSLFTLLGGGFFIGITVGMFWLMFYRKWQRYCERRYGKEQYTMPANHPINTDKSTKNTPEDFD